MESDKEIATLMQEHEVAETRVAEFYAQTDLNSLEDLQARERQMKDLRDRIVTSNVSTAAVRHWLEALERGVKNDTRSAKVTSAQDPRLDRLFAGLPLNRRLNRPAILISGSRCCWIRHR